ncbi:unnamed protein product [Arctia plantaginis]|uniref:tRNA (32-2'-O)-methyltransferase regulator THADA n=2 Tax=Arctia plantaginis TaxID=874455 RepID=A0A8S1A4J8_ARCPL|nr:unnamed protein product [Arctia plantaginis]
MTGIKFARFPLNICVPTYFQTRILSLSLIVESPKSTEEFTAGDLAFVLWYLKYNINAQAPNFRQLTLSCMKKFMKRLEDSYKVIKRQRESNSVNNKVEYYLRFVDQLRQQCFDSLLPGTNYSRRNVALQLLVWTHRLHLDGYIGAWTPDYVEKLLLHLEDSYENNKAFALEVLDGCPLDLLKNNTYSISIDIKDIFEQASSLKPTDCVSAAYKLDLLRRKLPDCILQNEQSAAAEGVRWALARRLVRRVRAELAQCRRSVVLAARIAPMYGLLHCLAHLLAPLRPGSISSDPQWTSLVDDIITTCMEVNEGVSSVVNNSSPEGHLPMDMTGVVVTDDGNSGGVMLDDGRQVTSQMVLLCAWRSVKEVSLLLGSISSRLSIAGEEGPAGTLSVGQLVRMGEHFTRLLAETKHRGAFEQAYVGFTLLLARLWRCRNPELHSLPPSWLEELMQAIASGEGNQTLCATRRSAGLPFMIQALVTTELQVQSTPKCFQSCMALLLELARAGASVETRCHALNILRALFRHSALDESVAPYVQGGLIVALQGFEGDSWAERNSSTLVLSALVVRVFGVARRRGPGAPAPRNTMTGRIFFLRYPQLYDFMLAKLQEVNSSKNSQLLRPSLYPVLLLLGRLYPSSLEGTVSNLKLVSFIPHVVACAGSSALQARQLAARALAPLVSPQLYIPHVQSMFALLKRSIKRNYCHGLLLQLVRLLEYRPEGLELPQFSEEDTLPFCVEDTLWILDQTTSERACYLIADEYTKVLNMIAWKFPSLLRELTIPRILMRLDATIFSNKTNTIAAGREVFLSNAVYLYFILLNKDIENSCKLIIRTLQHSYYEVVLSALNYLLILHDSLDEEKCKFQERLSSLANKKILDTLKRNDKYVPMLRKVLDNKYLECQHKSLKILTLEGNMQTLIIEARIKRELRFTESILYHLLECVRNEPENVTHMYLESLLNFVTNQLEQNNVCGEEILDVIRVVFEHSSSDNNENTRNTVVRFIEKNMSGLFNFDTTGLSEEHRFEFRATLWSTIITLLEDDEHTIRQRITDAVSSHYAVTSRILPSACAENIREKIDWERDSVAMFALIALLDFKSVVVTDDGNDECRVFDQNERYNIFLEETVWTSACADKILKCNHYNKLTPVEHVSSVLDNPVYRGTFDKLCNDNVVVFRKLVEGDIILRNDALNPKIQVFVNKLSNRLLHV